MNDLVGLAAKRAADRFGHETDFTAATFSHELMGLAGLNGAIDGRLVEVILRGRDDVENTGIDGYYRLRRK